MQRFLRLDYNTRKPIRSKEPVTLLRILKFIDELFSIYVLDRLAGFFHRPD